ncbi:hypothetical protein TNCV_4685731 [Trichonephila clavipes]|nr:hypothetical protein TNCV_4685731 [Trichonephila clavipes]
MLCPLQATARLRDSAASMVSVSLTRRHVSCMLKTPSLGLFGYISSPLRCQILSMTSTRRAWDHYVLSQRLCELPLTLSACSSLHRSACGNVSLNPAAFIARAELGVGKD